ncbi:MAG: CsbD family protein [Anaeromyxobacter sp.]
MNKDQIKGKMDELKGDVKKRIGGATDDPKQQGEGFLEEKAGQIRKGIGDLEEDAKARRDKDRDEP